MRFVFFERPKTNICRFRDRVYQVCASAENLFRVQGVICAANWVVCAFDCSQGWTVMGAHVRWKVCLFNCMLYVRCFFVCPIDLQTRNYYLNCCQPKDRETDRTGRSAIFFEQRKPCDLLRWMSLYSCVCVGASCSGVQTCTSYVVILYSSAYTVVCSSYASLEAISHEGCNSELV